MAIKTAVITDPMDSAGQTPEQQAIYEISVVRAVIRLDVDLVANVRSMYELKNSGADPDLLLIDYGGLSTSYGGGYERSVDQVRDACRWAEDHPGKLLVIWTEFTARLYKEVEETFAHLTNVLVRTYGTEKEKEVGEKMHAWFPDARIPDDRDESLYYPPSGDDDDELDPADETQSYWGMG